MGLTSIQIPSGILQENTEYKFRVRYHSEHDFFEPSEWTEVIATTSSVDYTVTPTTDSNVSVGSSSKTTSDGGSVQFTLTFDTGYELDSVSHGTVSGNTWTISNVTSDMTPSVSSQIKTYSVTPTTDSNVSVSPTSDSVNHDGDATFTLSYNTGYELDSVSHGTVSGDTWTISNVTSDMTPSVSSQIKTYTVTPTTDSNVSVSPTSDSVNHDGDATFTLSFSTDYELDSVSHGTVSGDTWTISNVTSDMTPSVSSVEQIQPGTFMDGGYYAGIIDSTQTDPTNGVRYKLILAPKADGESSSKLLWGGNGQAVTGADSKWDGYQNTQDIVADSNSHPAAEFCNNLSFNGYSDWYLPAADELELLYRMFKPSADSNWANPVALHGEMNGYNPNSDPTEDGYTTSDPSQTTLTDFQKGNSKAFEYDFYFTSTEYDASNAWYQSFPDGYQGYDKQYTKQVRAVRRVLI